MSTFKCIVLTFTLYFIFLLVSGTVSIVELAGDQYFQDETDLRLPEDANFTYDVDLVDVDGDRDLDIFFSNGALYSPNDGQQSRLYINDGTGVFSDETDTRLPVEQDDSRRATFADYDGDNDLDLFMSAASYDPVRIWINNGSGFFSDESSIRLPSLGGVFNCEPRSGDLDNDGDFDIMLGGSGQPSIILINDGSGIFTDETNERLPDVGSDNDNTKGFLIADFDRDNDLDIFEGNANDAKNRMLINNGHGLFTDESDERIPIDYFRTHLGRVCDYDKDNWIDIVIANTEVNPDQIWMNSGGRFNDETSDRFPNRVVSSFNYDAGDIDNDGWADLVFASSFGSYSEQNYLFKNDGFGFFSDVTEARLPQRMDWTRCGRFGDLDADGDVDIVLANLDEQNRLFINVSTPDKHPPMIIPPLVLSAMRSGPGPFPVYTHVLDYVSVNIGEIAVSLYFSTNGGEDYTEIPMNWIGGVLYSAEIPEQEEKTSVSYYFRAVDRRRNIATDPENAPEDVYMFTVGDHRQQTPVKVGENETVITLPKVIGLQQNRPNPFNPVTTIAFDIPGSEGAIHSVDLAVFDVRGHRIRSLLDSELVSGSYSIVWDGRDDNGVRVQSGSYLYTLRVEGERLTRKMTVLK